MKQNKDLSIINCVATSLLAIFFSIPVHEFIHFITFYAYGDKCEYFAATSVNYLELVDYRGLPTFHRIMATGGSASIVNALIGVVLLIVLINSKLNPMIRLFLTQLMGAHLTEGFGYFMIDGIFGAGDWGNVFSYFTDAPAFVSTLRIVLSVVGTVGTVCVFFILNYMSYYFIEDSEDKGQRIGVALRLHLTMFIVGVLTHFATWAQNPGVKSGATSFAFSCLTVLMWIPFFWGFMFTGVMKVLPPKKSRFLYRLPEKANYVLLSAGIILILIDIFVFGPGIYFN